MTREERIATGYTGRGGWLRTHLVIWYTCQQIQLLTTMEQRPKVVRDIELTCVVLHNMLRSHQGGADRPPTPSDDIQPQRANQGKQRHHETFRNPSREAKHQRDLLNDYFRHVGALAGQEDRV